MGSAKKLAAKGCVMLGMLPTERPHGMAARSTQTQSERSLSSGRYQGDSKSSDHFENVRSQIGRL